MLRFSNIRGGMRVLRRSPAFAATVILVLGLGIGINTLVFTVTDAVLLRPLPYPNPNQLVWISQGISPAKTEYALAPDLAIWRSQVQSFSQATAFSKNFRNFIGRGDPEQLLSAEVSAEFLSLLGTKPITGRSKQTVFFDNLLQRVGSLPGIDAVALCSSPPPVPGRNVSSFS